MPALDSSTHYSCLRAPIASHRPALSQTSRRFTPLPSCWSILSYFRSEVRFCDFSLAPVVTGHRSTGQGRSDQDGHWYPDGGAGVGGQKEIRPGFILGLRWSRLNILAVWIDSIRNTTFLGFTHERVGTLELLV